MGDAVYRLLVVGLVLKKQEIMEKDLLVSLFLTVTLSLYNGLGYRLAVRY